MLGSNSSDTALRIAGRIASARRAFIFKTRYARSRFLFPSRLFFFMENDSQPETPRIRTEAQIMFFDTDCAAVVHNIAYLRHIEVARTLLAESLGWRLREM